MLRSRTRSGVANQLNRGQVSCSFESKTPYSSVIQMTLDVGHANETLVDIEPRKEIKSRKEIHAGPGFFDWHETYCCCAAFLPLVKQKEEEKMFQTMKRFAVLLNFGMFPSFA